MLSHKGQHRAMTAAPVNLPELRERSGRTLEQIADTTKISIRFLRAIEAGDFAQLPGGIFTRSYVRQYADQIGIEAAVLLESCRVRGRSEDAA